MPRTRLPADGLVVCVSALRLYHAGGRLKVLTAINLPGLHCLRPGVRRYLIGFPILAVVPHRQCIPGKVPSPLARSTGSEDFSLTPCVGLTSITLKRLRKSTGCARYTPIYDPDGWPLPYYRDCWHGIWTELKVYHSLIMQNDFRILDSRSLVHAFAH